MHDLVVKNVNVLGDSIMAAKDSEGNIWAGINYFCKALGMDKKQRDWQVKKVKEERQARVEAERKRHPTMGVFFS